MSLPAADIERAQALLAEAGEIVAGARNQDYGHPRDNHSRTAQMWSAFLGVEITPEQVCWLNVLQKLSRHAHAPKHDNMVDVIGWTLNAELVKPHGE